MPLRVIHVGMGGWGQDWEENAIPPVREVERVACVDASPDVLAAAKKRLSLPDAQCFTSLSEALSAVSADAVVITAPVGAHVPLAVEAMEAGLDVLTEKPFATSLEEAVSAVALADKLGRTLMVSQNYRFYPGPVTATSLVSSGAVGELGSVFIDFRKWGNDAAPGTNKHYEIVHPLLFDMSIHHFDLLRKVTGQEPVSVFAKTMDPPWSRFVEEASAALVIEMSGGVVASYRGSWVSNGEPTLWAGDWRLDCAEGEIYFTGRNSIAGSPDGDAVEVRRRVGGVVEKPALTKVPYVGRSGSLGEFARAIAAGVEPESSGRQNLGSLALMEAAARSAASGQVEAVNVPSV
ncbi:Gfo/Idh/MocA family protein [Tenggerimyces flavus]|uniref:Gfo/Idh/MocA family oxidoreductase n=1 Tax=Tenggerimyces flavus TaxID=1708749 RepID=A0ABV7YA52_9ACTN|nr:Gfo/Idh/MocA family oxidoreductase [Tenggerimyces flavus]MBM7789036.1 putative dehydrogenase [Tenggerimyces flavus]